jgi:DNA replication and repair protein RecF
VIQQLSLTNFRNHASLEVSLEKVTVITGPNGSGKTAILEALSYLSVAESWKAERDAEVIKWHEPFARIVGDDREVALQRSPSYKRYRIDGVSKRFTEILGTLPTVLFQPDDSSLVYGSPAARRRLLDRLLSQVVPGYAKALTTLQKVLKQRNRLLKQIQEGEASTTQLDYWDTELATHAVLICDARRNLLAAITPIVQQHYQELMPTSEGISITYECSPRDGGDFLHHVQEQRTKEVQAGTTLYGPHREDLLFLYGEHHAAECLSRGQARALVLAIKLAEVAYVESQTTIPPILLLDDIFAEFDHDRRERIVSLLHRYQSVLTTTDMMGVEQHLPKGAKELTLQ